MELVKIEDDMPVFNPQIRMIKEFKKLLERDKGTKGDHDGRKKRTATKELAFIYFYCTFDSRFEHFEGEEKIDKIKEAVDLPTKWKVDDDMKKAIERYTFLMETASIRLYKRTIEALETLDPPAAPLDLQKFVKEMPVTAEAIEKSRRIIFKEQENKASKREAELSMVDKLGSKVEVGTGY